MGEKYREKYAVKKQNIPKGTISERKHAQAKSAENLKGKVRVVKTLYFRKLRFYFIIVV